MAGVTQQHDVTILELGPSYASLDIKALEAFGEVLFSEAAYAEPPRLLLDLAHTSFIGSAFIELLVRAWKRLKTRGGSMALCGLQPFCLEVLRIVRLDTVLPMHPTRSEAIAAFMES